MAAGKCDEQRIMGRRERKDLGMTLTGYQA